MEGHPPGNGDRFLTARNMLDASRVTFRLDTGPRRTVTKEHEDGRE